MSNSVECVLRVFGHKTVRKKFERCVKTKFEKFSFECITPKEADLMWRFKNLGVLHYPKNVKLDKNLNCHEYTFDSELVAPLIALKALSKVFNDLIFDLEYTSKEYEGRFIYMNGETFEEELKEVIEEAA